MNINTLGQNVAELADKLTRERELTPQAKDELIKAISVIKKTTSAELADLADRQQKAFDELLQAVADSFDARTEALSDALGSGVAQAA